MNFVVIFERQTPSVTVYSYVTGFLGMEYRCFCAMGEMLFLQIFSLNPLLRSCSAMGVESPLIQLQFLVTGLYGHTVFALVQAPGSLDGEVDGGISRFTLVL